MSKIKKTNAARILDGLGIAYDIKIYAVDEDLSAQHVAEVTGLDIDMLFKTLVVRGDKSGVIMAVIGGGDELNLKALAKVSGNKSVEMLALKDLLPVTGYVRGGCSPLGAKKHFPVYLDERALTRDKISISAGLRGMQIILAPHDLIRAVNAAVAKLSCVSSTCSG